MESEIDRAERLGALLVRIAVFKNCMPLLGEDLVETIILAGGLGSRLRSRLEGIPKAMAPVAGRPFLYLLLDQLSRQGCDQFLISVGYLREYIISKIGHSFNSVPVRYVIEDSPLGTGGAIRRALSKAVEPAVLILNGDTFAEADYRAMLALHNSKGRSMTMAVTRVGDTARYGGVVVNEGNVIGFLEKGRLGEGWINAGAYVIQRDFRWPEQLESKFSFEMDVLGPHIHDLRPAAYEITGRFLDIGIPQDLDRANIELLSEHNQGE